jgi:hypothetical protein
VFSGNEMVVITAKGNPLGLRDLGDLAKPAVRIARVTGEKDLATGRTVEFLKRAALREGKPEIAQQVADKAPIDPAKPVTVPDVVNAVRQGGRHRHRLLGGGRRAATSIVRFRHGQSERVDS